MSAIGLYMPEWLCKSEPSDRLFLDDLAATLRAGGCEVMLIDLERPLLECPTNLVAVVQHHSPFFSTSLAYAKNIQFLQSRVRLFNSPAAQAVGYNKALTQKCLRLQGLPVLDSYEIRAKADFYALKEDTLHVIKPIDRGAGEGVKLVKREGQAMLQHHRGNWLPVMVEEVTEGLRVRPRVYNLPFFLREPAFTYAPMLVEPFFNNGVEEFASLRCTVIGDEVVESVRRVNSHDITSNVSRGGTATATTLTFVQRDMAIAASRAIGADYSGVDLLVKGEETVIGEVNIGPITIFTAYTGVRVGQLFGKYVLTELAK